MWRVMPLLVLAATIAGAQPPQEARTVKKRPETADPAVRCVLPGVPWIGFFRGDNRGPEDDPFPACLRALLEYRGENLGLTPKQSADPWHVVHVYLKGACGASFRIGWDPQGWDWGALELLGMPGDPLATFRDGLAAAGYEGEVLLRRDFARAMGVAQDADYDEATFRERIMASIRRGLPVLALGVVGPPECSLITGYDEGGQVLVGRSFFQNEADEAPGLEFEEAGGGVADPYFRKRDWFASTRGLILVGEKITRPADREIHRRALRRALELMRTPVVRGHWTGLAALTIWADTLLRTEPFPDDLATLRKRHQYHHSAGGTLAEARAYGADFLRGMADLEPAAATELREAAKCFDDEHDLVWAIWEFTGGMIANDEGARKFGSLYLRGRLAPLIRLARRRDAEAAEHLERALALLGDQPADPETPGRHGRLVLEGVPRAGYDVHLCPFPGSLYAIMQYLGDPVSYEYLMGVTGAAFRRVWHRDDGGNVDLGYLGPEVYRRAGEGIGYELRVVPRAKAPMIAALRESLAQGRPAIGFGLIGPPEAGIVTGYSLGGETLHGWSYFQEGKPAGYYADTGWFEKFSRFAQAPDGGLGPVGIEPPGLVLVGDKCRWPGPPPRERLASSLGWIVDLARTARRPHLPQHVCGLAAYEAWARALEVDADYPAADQQVLATRAMVHCDQVVMLHERQAGAEYLRQMAGQVPEVAAELSAAASLYEEVGRYAGQVWKWGHWMEPAALQGLADPKLRREFAAGVRAAAAKEAQAVALLETARRKLTDHETAPGRQP